MRVSAPLRASFIVDDVRVGRPLVTDDFFAASQLQPTGNKPMPYPTPAPTRTIRASEPPKEHV